jgi:transcriptional regulator with XRE-family HTH domain
MQEKHSAPDSSLDPAEPLTQQAARIKALRIGKGLSVGALAAKAHISPNTIRALERGKRVRGTTVHLLLDALNTRPIYASEKLLIGEALDVALLYQEATTSIRMFVMDILRQAPQQPDPLLLALAHELGHLTVPERDSIEALLQHYKRRALSTAKSTSKRRTSPDKNHR